MNQRPTLFVFSAASVFSLYRACREGMPGLGMEIVWRPKPLLNTLRFADTSLLRTLDLFCQNLVICRG